VAIVQAQQSQSPIQSTRCNSDQQCQQKFPHTTCRNNQFCQCDKDFTENIYNGGGECHQLASQLDSECEIDVQCTQSVLGSLSRCDPDEKICKCFDTRGNGRNETLAYRNTCFYKKSLGDRCDIEEECRASIEPENSVTCSSQRRVCICKDGDECSEKSAANSMQFKFLGFFTIVLINGLARIVFV